MAKKPSKRKRKPITKKWTKWKIHDSDKGAKGHADNLNKRKGIKAEVRKKKEVWVKKE